MGIRQKIFNNFSAIIIFTIFIIDFIFMLSIHTKWNETISKYIPIKDQTISLRYNITEAHLWLEEAIGGDQYVDVEKDVLARFAHMKFHGLKNILIDEEDRRILKLLQRVDELADEIHFLAKERWENNKEFGIGSDSDQEFDRYFNSFLDLSDKAILEIEAKLSQEIQERDTHFKIILAIFFAINIFVYILLYSIKHAKRKTDILLYKEKKLATVTLQSIGDAVITVDMDAKVTFLNTVAQKLTGYKSTEALGLPLIDVFNIINKQSQLSVENPVEIVIKNGVTVGLSNHTVLISKNGTKYDIADSAAPIHDTDNKIIGVVLVFRDVTDEYKIKEELLALNTELEEKVKERTEKLEKSFEEIEKTQEHLIQTEKMASLGSLVAGIAHEINTPIGLGITSMTHFTLQTKKLMKLYEDENMAQEDFEKYVESADKLAQVTYENLKRAAELINSFKQISIDQTNEYQRKFNIMNYTQETLLSMHNKIKSTNIEVKVNCSDDLEIYSYPGAFSQIITNLVMNSLVHAYPEKESGLITLSFKDKNSTLEFIYRDDGKGIKKEDLNQIFDPFFTTNRAHGGSGLGLNIIFNIITTQLGGTIECRSEESKGIEFIMLIPINRNQE